ncbi:glycosyltransferase [Parasphingorhabdus pacifica]
MRILIWHVHGSWTTAFVHGPNHTYLVPRKPGGDADGKGRPDTFTWPGHAVEVPPEELAELPVDALVLQRPHEVDLAEEWLGRRPGIDVPAVYVEHDAPRGEVAATRHPLADRDDIPVVHVTHFNRAFWDCGRAPTSVVEHGIIDPGYRYTGELPRAAAAINEPLRRARIAGTDLLPSITGEVPLDLFGMRVCGVPEWLGTDSLTPYENFPQADMHSALALRRVYVHPYRWTSLGLSLLEAMQLGMPVVALATTEAVEAVPPEAGVVSTRLDVLADAVADFVADPDRAREIGAAARESALRTYSLDRFHTAWDDLLEEVTR